MRFDEQQQAYIDTLIKAKYTEAYAKAEQKYQDALEQATEAKLEPLKARLDEAHGKLRIMEIRSAAAEHGAVNASQVAALMDGSIKVDDSGSLFVIDGEGERRYSKDGAPLSVGQAVQSFLDENPHLAGRRASTGAGSAGYSGFPGGLARTITRREYDQMSPEAQMEKVFDGVKIVD